MIKQYFTLFTALGLLMVSIIACKKNKPEIIATEPKLYFAGDTYAPMRMGLVWKNETREIISDGLFPHIRAVYASGNDVYLAGWIDESNGKRKAYYWKNGTPVALTGGSFESQANGVQVAGSDLYVVGSIVNQDGKSNACYWKNGTLVKLNATGYVASSGDKLVVVGTDVYVCGTVYADGSGKGNACYWKNGVLHVFEYDQATYNLGTAATSIAISANDVYVCGIGYPPPSDNRIWVPLYWKNGVEVKLNMIATGIAWDIVIDKQDVYIAGYINVRGGYLHQPVIWKNGQEQKLETTMEGIAYEIAVKDNTVFACGRVGKSAVYWKNGKINYLSLPEANKEAVAWGLHIN